MKYTLEYLEQHLDNLKAQQFSWVISLDGKKDENEIKRTEKIISELAVKITSIEHDIKLIKATRGLNEGLVKQMVDHFYRTEYYLDENDEWIPKEK